MTYAQATQLFAQQNPDSPKPGQPGFDDAFNNWSGTNYPNGGWQGADAPTSVATIYNPNDPQNNPTNPFSGNSSLGTLIGNAGAQGAQGATLNPNTQEVMTALQGGQTSSAGTTNTTGTQSQQGLQSSTTSGNQTTSGTTTGNLTGSTTGLTSGTTTGTQTGQTATTGLSQPVDTLGLGALLQSQIPGATQSTSIQQDFLRNLVANGPQQQQDLTSRAVANALSGPGMIGVGDNARARAAGYAAGDVGLQSLGQQLQGAAQLAGPTAATTLANAGNPFVGTQTSGNQATTGTTTGQSNQLTSGTTNQSQSGTNNQSTANQANSLNLSSLLNNTNTNTDERQTGASSAQSGQVGVGTVPISTQQTSGGCYVCTAWGMNPGVIRRAAQWKLKQPKYRRSLVGYSLIGPWLARNFLVPKLAARLVLYEEARLSGVRVRRRLDATLCHALFHYGFTSLAYLTFQSSIKQCSPSMVALLQRNNLLFEV